LFAISPNKAYVGPFGAGHTLKAMNNMMSAANRRIAFEAVSIAGTNGIDPVVAVYVIDKSFGRNNKTMTVCPNNVLALAAELVGDGLARLTPLILRNSRMGIERFGVGGHSHKMLRCYKGGRRGEIAKLPAQPPPLALSNATIFPAWT
jgi:hypothetical protein